MIEVKVNIELGVNAEFKEFVTNLLMASSVHTGTLTTGTLTTGTLTTGTANMAVVEHLTKPRHRAAAMAAPAPEEKVEQEAEAPTEQAEQAEQAGQEQPKSAITLPDLREAVKRLYNGGAHKEELPIIFGQFGVKNVTEAKEEQYQELFDTLNAKSEELGL